MKWVKVLSLVFLMLAASQLWGYALEGVDWNWCPNPPGPMCEPYEVNPNCQDASAGTPDDQIAYIQNGADAWTNEGNANFTYNYGGTTTIDDWAYDGHNVCTFVMYSTNSIATCYYWSSSGNIYEFDIVFNDLDYQWNGVGDPAYNEMDIWNIAAHEFGHGLGMGHSEYYWATMYAYADYGETYKRDLYFDDIDGIQAIYGIQGPDITLTPNPVDVFNSDTGVFFVKNVGMGDLTVYNVDVSPTSWITSASPTNFTVNAGDSQTVTFLMDTLGLDTLNNGIMVVYSNDNDEPQDTENVTLHLGGPDSSAAYWFSLSETDPTQITNLPVAVGDTIALHAWLFVRAPHWDLIGGFTFPIGFDTLYLNAIGMTCDENSLGNYMFHGTRWPGDSLGENPGQALWYAAVCFSGCMNVDSTPYHIGSISFVVLQSPSDSQMVIDTLMYPPSNYANLGNEGGTATVWPEWHQFYISSGIICGDINGDAQIGIGDITYLANYLFAQGPPPVSNWAADVNGDGSVNTNDLVYYANYLFGGGPGLNCP